MDPTAPSDAQDENATGIIQPTPGPSPVNESGLNSAPSSANKSDLTPQTENINETPNPEEIYNPKNSLNQDNYSETPQTAPSNANNYNQFQTEQAIPERTDSQDPLNQSPPQTPSQNPPADTPQIFTSQVQSPNEAVTDKPKKSKKIFFFLFFVFFSVLILAGLGGLTYAVAYEKIKLEKYPDLQKQVSYFVMELPFMPKTPKYLLAKSAMAHQDITKQSFDISIAIDSADISSFLGLSNLDIQAKGAFDYTDPKNVFGNLEVSFTKDFNAEFRKKDEMLYFKLNKLPSFFFAFLGISTTNFDPLMNKWVSYDTTPLETEARKSIQEDREIDPLSQEFIDKNFEKYIDDEILSKMKLASDVEEGYAVHKITLDADSKMIDYLGEKIESMSRQKSNYVYPQKSTSETDKLSDFIKKFRWEMYIDKETYYTRKVIFNMDLEYDSSDGVGSFSLGSLMNPLPSNNTAKIAFAAKFDKFGDEVMVEKPPESITLEEFTDLLSSVISELYGGVFNTVQSQSADSKRKSDLQNLQSALEIYYVEQSKYPANLSDLTQTYITIIPSDIDGESYYYQVSNDANTYSLCTNLESPPTTSTTCPDPSYNYHITPTSVIY